MDMVSSRESGEEPEVNIVVVVVVELVVNMVDMLNMVDVGVLVMFMSAAGRRVGR